MYLQPGQEVGEEARRPGDDIEDDTRGPQPEDHIDNDPYEEEG